MIFFQKASGHCRTQRIEGPHPRRDAFPCPGSSGVEQWIENPRVGGSIPPPGTIHHPRCNEISALRDGFVPPPSGMGKSGTFLFALCAWRHHYLGRRPSSPSSLPSPFTLLVIALEVIVRDLASGRVAFNVRPAPSAKADRVKHEAPASPAVFPGRVHQGRQPKRERKRQWDLICMQW